MDCKVRNYHIIEWKCSKIVKLANTYLDWNSKYYLLFLPRKSICLKRKKDLYFKLNFLVEIPTKTETVIIVWRRHLTKKDLFVKPDANSSPLTL